MANHLYGYDPSYGVSGGASAYSSISATESSIYSSSRYLYGAECAPSDPSAYAVTDRYSYYLRYGDDLRVSDAAAEPGPPGYTAPSAALFPAAPRVPTTSSASWAAADAGAAHEPLSASYKRPMEALYHQTLLGSHNTFGQTEDWYSTNSLVKRPRLESASNLPIYPQRPGEKDCAHYMVTRTCKFGDSCKFDHPVWVPEGGIPDWKEVAIVTATETLPERPGEPDCPYFLKTQKCKFGEKCKFNHPKDRLDTTQNADSSFPERPSEPPCPYYLKTGTCKFGGTCKFHHPKNTQVSAAGQQYNTAEHTALSMVNGGTGDSSVLNAKVSVSPALMHNSKGLPIRQGEVDCPFYMKTGSCKYGSTCRYNHPDLYAFNPPAAAVPQTMLAPTATNLHFGVVSPLGSFPQYSTAPTDQAMLRPGSAIYPQRPGQIECDFYMKNGECKFGEQCRFHHPIDRSGPTLSMIRQAQEPIVKLTPAGLPRREGAVICPYYLKTATCKYGATCKFDHPPPGEVMAIATAAKAANEEKECETEAETAEGQKQ